MVSCKARPRTTPNSYTDNLVEIHKGVEENSIQGKTEDKQLYDKRHKVVEPSWCVGDRVGPIIVE